MIEFVIANRTIRSNSNSRPRSRTLISTTLQPVRGRSYTQSSVDNKN